MSEGYTGRPYSYRLSIDIVFLDTPNGIEEADKIYEQIQRYAKSFDVRQDIEIDILGNE